MPSFELIRLSANHWYTFEGEDIDLRGNVGLVGRSGAGKSTIEDAILTVLYAANKAELRPNSSASNRRSSRDLKGYCLGTIYDVDDNAYLRNEAYTTLVLTFQNKVTGEFVCGGVMLSATPSDDDAVDVAQFVIRGYDFKFSDWMTGEGEERELLTQKELLQALRATHPENFFHAQSKKDFVNELLTSMNPRATVDPKRFTRALTHCRNLKEITNATEFVRSFVLDEKKLDVTDVRRRIERWRELDEQVKGIKTKISYYAELRNNRRNYVSNILEKSLLEICIEDVDANALRIELQADEQSLRTTMERIEEAKLEIETQDRILQSLEAEARRLVAAHDSDGRVQELQSLRESVKLNTELYRAAGSALMSLLKRLGRLGDEKFMEIGGLQTDVARRLRDGVRAAASYAEMSQRSLDESFISTLRQGKLAATASSIAHLSQDSALYGGMHGDLAAKRFRLKEEVDELQKQFDAAVAGQRYAPDYVERLVAELRTAGIPATILSDVVSVRDPEWAPALSMVLGDDQTAILVPAARVKDAFKVQSKSAFPNADRCRIVRTNRLSSHHEPRSGSLFEEVKSDDSQARLFLLNRIGGIMKAEDEAQADGFGVAVTRTGFFAGALVAQKLRGVQAFIGATGNGSLVDGMRRALAEKRKALEDVSYDLDLVQRLSHAMVVAEGDVEEDLRSGSSDVLRYATDIAQGMKRIKALEADGVPDVQALLAGVEARKQEALSKKAEADGKKDVANRRLGQLDTSITENRPKLVLKQETVKNRSDFFRSAEMAIVLANAQFDVGDHLPAEGSWAFSQLDAQSSLKEQTVELGNIRKRLTTRIEEINFGLKSLQSRLTTRLGNIREEFPEELDVFKEEYRIVQQTPEVHYAALAFFLDRLDRLQNHELLPHQQRLSDARTELDKSLKEGLLARLYEHIRVAQRSIAALNDLLSKGKYVGGMHYSFRREESPEHVNLLKLIRALAARPQEAMSRIVDGQEIDDDLEGYKEALSEIDRMLQTGEGVDRLADYRKYHQYSIRVHSPTGGDRDFTALADQVSGGEKEAPYYLAVAATMRSVYHPADDGDEGMALVVLDEAFAKLDTANTKRLIQQFTDMGLQLIIAAPEDKLPVIAAGVDTILQVYRPPGSREVTLAPTYPKERYRQDFQDVVPGAEMQAAE